MQTTNRMTKRVQASILLKISIIIFLLVVIGIFVWVLNGALYPHLPLYGI